MLTWPLLEWTKASQFKNAWTSGTLKRDLLASFSPVSSGVYALPEGLCSAGCAFNCLEEDCDRYLVSFVGSSFSTSECSLCGCINDIYQHASQLAIEDVSQSYISIRPVPALKRLWEASTNPTAKEKSIVQLSEKEYKFFFGHRLPWTVQLQPPAQLPQGQPMSATTATAGARPAQQHAGGAYAEPHPSTHLQRADSSNSHAMHGMPSKPPTTAAAAPTNNGIPLARAPTYNTLPPSHARPPTLPPTSAPSMTPTAAQNGYVPTYTTHSVAQNPPPSAAVNSANSSAPSSSAQRSTQIKFVMKRAAN